MPVMSNHTPLFFGPEAAGSFTGQVSADARRCALPPGRVPVTFFMHFPAMQN